MWQFFGTLRFKLSVLNLAVFGLLLVLLNATILIVREQELRQQFDARLRDRAEIIVDEITIPLENRTDPLDAPASPGRFNPFRFPGYFFQLRSAEGDVLERSKSLGAQTLPLESVTARAKDAGAPILDTIHDDVARSLLEGDAELRLLTLYRDEPGSPPFYLQMAVSTEALERSIGQLRLIVWTVGLAALVMAGAASWLLAGRSLAPLARVARLADELHAGQFAPRFETPSGEDEVADMVSRINAMLDRLSDSFLSQERFIADAAHE
ncbi:MAG: HAMP domain-containing protein, partial [Phycisphaerae bacterium]